MKHAPEPVIDDATLAVLLSALADMPEPELPVLPILPNRIVCRYRIHPPQLDVPALTDEECAAFIEVLRTESRE